MAIREQKEELKQVYAALREKGYAPLSQLVGWLLTVDPTYITTHNGARNQIARLDRDELLRDIVADYCEKIFLCD